MHKKLAWSFVVNILILLPCVCFSERVTNVDVGYRKLCFKASKSHERFYNFRASHIYSDVVEVYDGSDFAEYILNSGNEKILKNLKAFRRLDVIGGPYTLNHGPLIGNFSGTVLKYIVIADHIGNLFDLPKKAKIVEMGADFGGQCYILSQLQSISKYYVYDLPEVNALIGKVAKYFDLKMIQCLEEKAKLPEDKVDLFISNYAFSECDKETQLGYFERVLKKADRGYLIYSSTGMNSLTSDEFVELLSQSGMNPRVYPELVATHPNNVVIVWDKAFSGNADEQESEIVQEDEVVSSDEVETDIAPESEIVIENEDEGSVASENEVIVEIEDTVVPENEPVSNNENESEVVADEVFVPRDWDPRLDVDIDIGN